MRIELGLHHADLGVAQLLTPPDGLVQVGMQALDHSVEAAGKLAHLVRGAHLEPGVEPAFLDRAHGGVQLAYRLKQLAAQPHRHKRAERKADQYRHCRDDVEQAHDPVRDRLGLHIEKYKAGGRALRDVELAAAAVGQALAGEQPVAQQGGEGFPVCVLRAIDAVPVWVEQQQSAGADIG